MFYQQINISLSLSLYSRVTSWLLDDSGVMNTPLWTVTRTSNFAENQKLIKQKVLTLQIYSRRMKKKEKCVRKKPTV